MLRAQQGFTLTELIIGMAVMALIMAAVFGILSSSIQAQVYGFSQERSYSEARRVMQAASDELRYSTNQVIAAGNGDITYLRPNDTDGNVRTGRIQNIAGTGQVQITRGDVDEVLGAGLVQVGFAQGALAQQVQVTVTALVSANSSNSTIVLRSTVWTGPILWR